ncbi:uncharacterized protein TRIREDRAFT_111465 [Trichoderma reesei QM6a]|uniref:Predicted protein n=2 Tax=Hypocrea jecorina TaxID=51453 RepID=G0RUN8_HYPJQ|nr:uncharacterized protein TRIREDRAFT_111465 [Trichoderma reesei QM6a]EGR45104.1 predicted protein [Trichoderma reesei QM6a]ETR98251.1 hypothetical protein M419DRAFT_133762 [Trichoderma reesei RUT C-30]
MDRRPHTQTAETSTTQIVREATSSSTRPPAQVTIYAPPQIVRSTSGRAIKVNVVYISCYDNVAVRTLSEHGNGSGSFQKKVGGVERIESGWGKSTYKVQVRIFLREGGQQLLQVDGKALNEELSSATCNVTLDWCSIPPLLMLNDNKNWRTVYTDMPPVPVQRQLHCQRSPKPVRSNMPEGREGGLRRHLQGNKRLGEVKKDGETKWRGFPKAKEPEKK